MENKILLAICIIFAGIIFYNSCSEIECPTCPEVIKYESNDSIIDELKFELDSIKNSKDSIYIKIDSIFKSIDDIEIKVDSKSKKEALEWIEYYNSQQSH